ncbi:hypothetical protein JVT61DRAFT_8771 [Boletus reticuloceps]|uniref:TPR-like protein n=1 Tax=Boletus reticuloceps TaxID=495285 RepID=A0A8I3A6J3_9AGAM|nr:hypothetical protein JVT61DRAFT_8771 [Boletus reticuloceps]
MAHGKDRHYWAQLRAALTAGVWASSAPAKTPGGGALTWSELIRKFNKHCTGFQDVAEIASQTQALSIWLSANATDEDQLGSEPDEQLCLESECMLLPERVQEATPGYEALQKLQSTRSDSLFFALAYYAYALGEPSQCLDYLSKVPGISDAQGHIPLSSTVRSDGSTLHPPGSTTDTSTSWTGTFVSAEIPPSTTNIIDGRAWAIAESIRSICLQGMCNEKLHSEDPELAIQSYATAIPLLNITEFEILRSLTASASPSSFPLYRELWRWVERVMFRAITLLARTRHLDDQGLIWNFFTHYELCSAHWPPTFRTSHRSIINVLHLRALIVRFRAPSPPVNPSPSMQPETPPQWFNTARSIINEYRTILDKCAHFPRAGERNVKVEDLVDLSVAAWEASGAVADRAQWVIDVLWWATRLTFNSYRVFRHMSRLLYISGDAELAKRTLRLYVEVVSKTRAAGVDGDSDTDRHWVETLVEGARMFCRLALSRFGSGGVEEAKEAGELLEKAKTRLDSADKELVARVALAEGIWNTTTAIIERDSRTRPTKLRNALERYIHSVEVFPTPSAHHQLAIALALPSPSQNLEDAITSARAAVEGAPNEIRHWHLLGLLLTTQEEWTKAQEVLEIGASITESLSEPDEPPSDTEASPDQTEKSGRSEGVAARDLETEKCAEVRSHDKIGGVANGVHVHEMILDPDATTIPPSDTLLYALPDHPDPTSQDAFEYALQLRLTQMALAEHVEGPEGAEAKWVDVFGWIAEQKGTVSETQLRSSVDTGSRSAVTQPGSVVLVSETHETVLEVKTELPSPIEPSADQSTSRTRPPPITVTPATPADTERKFPLSPLLKRSSTDRDGSTGKKVQQMLKNRVHKGQAKISTISRRIGHGVVRNGNLKRANSAPDFHAVLQNHHYQASSIHSRMPLRSLKRNSNNEDSEVVDDCPVPPPPPPTPPLQDAKPIPQASREDKLLSELWASSAATFRRLGKIDQAKGAIQEAEVKNQENPSVWVQFGLYHHALNHDRQAIEAFQKALFMCPNDVSATVHMCRIYLTPRPSSRSSESSADPDPDKVDLSAGLLGYMSHGSGWDVPEIWYFLAKAYGLRGQKDKQRECLTTALSLSENRCIRDLGRAVGWCL